jgi:hypothetical protein
VVCLVETFSSGIPPGCLEVKDPPVRTLSNERSQIVHVDFKFVREQCEPKFNAFLNPCLPLDDVRLWPGPMKESDSPKTFLDGVPMDTQLENERDALWVWLTLRNLAAGEHHLLVINH